MLFCIGMKLVTLTLRKQNRYAQEMDAKQTIWTQKGSRVRWSKLCNREVVLLTKHKQDGNTNTGKLGVHMTRTSRTKMHVQCRCNNLKGRCHVEGGNMASV